MPGSRLTSSMIWDNLDEYVRTVPSAVLKVDWLTTMLAEMYDIEELDPDLPKQPHITDERAVIREHVLSWLESAGRIK